MIDLPVVVISRALTSDSLYLRWPPRVLIEVNLPAFAQRVTVFGSTRNKLATSDGVSSVSCSVFNFLLSNPFQPLEKMSISYLISQVSLNSHTLATVAASGGAKRQKLGAYRKSQLIGFVGFIQT